MTHMTKSIGIRALQQNASAVVASAAAGETVEVTDRGRPVAQVVPLPQGELASRVRAGVARPASRRVIDLPPPLPGKATGASLGELLAEARANER